MTMVWILLLALAGVVAAWAWGEVARQRRRAKTAEAALVKKTRQIEKMQEAYRVETERLAELATGTDDERFDASLRILRELSRRSGTAD